MTSVPVDGIFYFLFSPVCADGTSVRLDALGSAWMHAHVRVDVAI
jgi:hypothetical protein